MLLQSVLEMSVVYFSLVELGKETEKRNVYWDGRDIPWKRARRVEETVYAEKNEAADGRKHDG